MLKKIVLISVSTLVLVGCSATPEPAPTLYGGQPAPQTDAEVIDLVSERYGDCFEKLGDAEFTYARSSSGELLPGDFLAAGEGWSVLITVSALTDKGVLPTVPGSEKSVELLTSVGCG